MRKFRDLRVKAVFDAYPRVVRSRLLALRTLIFDTAARTESVGELEEALKWGQPSYLTAESRAGSTIRIDSVKGRDRCAIYFNCHTSLVETFRELYPDKLRFESNRAILLETEDVLPTEELSHCIALALTYHSDKRSTKSRR